MACLVYSCNSSTKTLFFLIAYFSSPKPALLVAAAHSTVGGDEKDGRQKICGIVSYQLHRDIEAVSCSGRINDDDYDDDDGCDHMIKVFYKVVEFQ